MSNPTATVLNYITLAGSPLAKAQERAMRCQPHEWHDLEEEEGEDPGIGIMMVQDGHRTGVRPCALCDAAEVRFADGEGRPSVLVLLRSDTRLAAAE